MVLSEKQIEDIIKQWTIAKFLNLSPCIESIETEDIVNEISSYLYGKENE